MEWCRATGLVPAVLCIVTAVVSAQDPVSPQLGPPPLAWPEPAPLAAPAETDEPRVAGPLALDTSDRADVTAFYDNVLLPALAVQPGWTGSVAGCNPGATSQAYTDATLSAVNFFRAMTGLPADITLNPVKNAGAQAAALMMTANNSLSHTPPVTWNCYTPTGADAAGRSNLALGAGGARAIRLYIQDAGTNNYPVGHRRWILYPRIVEMGTGSTANANALWVTGSTGTRPASPEFVAWPSRGYVPYDLVFRRWSFSPNTSASVNFTSTIVTMTQDGVPLPSQILPEVKGYGDATLVWEAQPTLAAGMPDRTITVRLDNVLVGGVSRTYEYTVIAFDPRVVPDIPSTDSDGDGLPDAWEIMFGLDPASSVDANGANGDPDGDGRTNRQEYEDGTHPRGFFTRYLAEGATSTFFDTQFALLAPGPTDAMAVMRFLRRGQPPIGKTVAVPSRRRVTVTPKSIAGLAAAEFSVAVESDQPLVVDRTMTWDGTGYGSHSETAVAAPSTTWYFAEGATISGFQLFYLLQNPSTHDVPVKVRYLRTTGGPLEKTYVLPAQSRENIWANREQFDGLGTALASAEFSAVVESLDGTPIIVERAMYLSSQGRTFNAGHGSAGVTTPATRWFFAEGNTGNYFDLFVLIANPTGTDAQVKLTYLLGGDDTFTRTMTAPANARSGVWVDHERFEGVAGLPLANVAVSTTVESLNGVPLVVERAMWWPGNASTWHEAHSAAGATTTGTVWAVAEGEVGGSRRVETYLLIANTSARAGLARVTLYFEDGTSAERVYELAPSSRTNVNAAADFGAVVQGRRFGAVVESIGPSPASIVVERAMYSNAGGVSWAAGTSATATRLSGGQ